MTLDFFKYQGTGNDFILIDNRQHNFSKNNTKLVARLCDRKFGIGADGLIVLENSSKSDFSMTYYNADGNEGSLCGNGGRCIVAFANYLGIIDKQTQFEAFDGLHEAYIENNLVHLKMKDITDIDQFDTHLFLDTGSPHHIEFVTDVDTVDVFNLGRKIRNGSPYFEEGSNVNFVEQQDDNTFKVRTYERGVEDETLSCGTGVAAVAIGSHRAHKTKETSINLLTLGGELKVSFDHNNNAYENVFLIGPATLVFQGSISI